MRGTSALNLGVVSGDRNCGEGSPSSLGREDVDGKCNTGICGDRRKSEEPVLLHLNPGRLTLDPEVWGLSITGDLRSPLKVPAEFRWTGDNGGGGRLGRRVGGLYGKGEKSGPFWEKNGGGGEKVF